MKDGNFLVLGRYTGSRWLVVGISLLLVALFYLGISRSLLYSEEQAEKVLVELTLRNIGIGLKLAQAEAMLHGRANGGAALVGSNPMDGLEPKPKGYVGDCKPGAQHVLEAGVWCFDRATKELLYRPRHVAHLQLKDGRSLPLLRWSIVLEKSNDRGDFTGVRVENLTPYVWFAE